MTRAGAALAAAVLAAGCVTRTVDPIAPAETRAPPAAPAPSADPVEAMADMDLRIECDRAQVVIPERLRAEAIWVGNRQHGQPPPWTLTVRRLTVVTRELWPSETVGGEDFSIVAEGGVRTVRREGAATVEEGPFHTLVLRNGRLLRR